MGDFSEIMDQSGVLPQRHRGFTELHRVERIIYMVPHQPWGALCVLFLPLCLCGIVYCTLNGPHVSGFFILYVKSEIGNIAVLHHVFLAL
jgi:hypothetical protein